VLKLVGAASVKHPHYYEQHCYGPSDTDRFLVKFNPVDFKFVTSVDPLWQNVRFCSPYGHL